MAVQNVRGWQWVLAGLVIGAAVALAWTNAGDNETVSSSWGFQRFARTLQFRDDEGKPILTNILVDPLMSDANGNKVQRVYFTVKMKNIKTQKYEPVEDASIVTGIPALKGSPIPENTIQDYLIEQQKNLSGLEFKYAWWKVSGLNSAQVASDKSLYWWQKPRNAWLTAVGGGVLVIGVLWPIFIKGLISAGLLPKPDRSDIDLSKVRNIKVKEEAKKPRVTADDELALADLNARLEEKVGGMLIRADKRDDAAEQKKEEAMIRQLSNVPIEQQGAQQTEENKEYQGEFYPVVKPHHSEDDAQAKKEPSKK